ncbi:glutathione S-transferase family protein [Brevundimonas sp.]|uniref:glutathione S-transferase family protein n=1 Tax=Brevundimonas sp. TaxID=1871086 RepID=UPI002737E729|nr:glutathione S-transferase family protein [Brevundimonas sp.]MDP3801156.1 glutathione S-transferase family protein [Brevundimonas sp.]
MAAPVTVIGSPVSPYVRKVLAVCAMKGVEVELDPISPMMGNDDFERLSPLRRVPVWIEGDLTLCDSSVIVQYIEETRPGPSLWPADPAERAKARWLEEFADTRLFDVLGWRLFFQIALKPRFFGTEADPEIVEKARDVELPQILDYLEGQMPERGFLFGGLTMADLSLAPAFANAGAVQVDVDASRWRKLAAWLERMEAETPLGPLNKLARTLMRTPLHAHRDRLPEFGLAAASRSWAGEGYRRGPMTPA